MENTSLIVAFSAGLLAFLSPCVLPLIPSYLSYLTGVSFKELSGEITSEKRKKIKLLTALHAIFFILGFSIVFILLGTTATFLGSALLEHQDLIKRIGGVLIIFFGLTISGIINIPGFQRSKKFSYKKEGISFVGSLLVGATFAAAWTPCIGPILGSILVYASSTADMQKGVILLSVFSLGLAVPFFISALAINTFLIYVKKLEKILRWVNFSAGIILIIFGILLLAGVRV